MRENPFKARVCEVFSSSGSGMTFGDFLDMCSVFSEGTQIKCTMIVLSINI